jgi:hypothetical protein
MHTILDTTCQPWGVDFMMNFSCGANGIAGTIDCSEFSIITLPPVEDPAAWSVESTFSL